MHILFDEKEASPRAALAVGLPCATFMSNATRQAKIVCILQVKGFNAADIVEKEKKRLEVIKRRQERELSQLLQYEVTRQQLQVTRPVLNDRFPLGQA